jgi:hypothetical protein
MNASAPIYQEQQAYRTLPPFTMLSVVGVLFGWFLIIWCAVLGRPLGDLLVPPWLALAIGLPLGILLPISYYRLKMVTEVYPDRVAVKNGLSSGINIPISTVADVQKRSDNILGDYNVRNVGTVLSTRTAYTVATNNGVELTLDDGRQILIGSEDPDSLETSILSSWRVVRPEKLIAREGES